MKSFIKVLGIIVALSAPQAFAQEHEHEHQSEHEKHVMAQGGAQSEYSLIKIMHDLAFNLQRIQFGILTNNSYMISEGAKAIANHPMPKGGLKPYIKKNQDSVKQVVGEMDKRVHQTAMKLAESASTLSMQEAMELSNRITDGCVGCHNIFRD